jgi:hypothetical protein
MACPFQIKVDVKDYMKYKPYEFSNALLLKAYPEVLGLVK